MIKGNGKILVRESGTEDLIRLFIQHKNTEEIERLLNYFYDNINKKHLL
jgi:phosphomannomutase